MKHETPERAEIERLARNRGFWPSLLQHPLFKRATLFLAHGKREEAGRLQAAALEDIQAEASILNRHERRHFTEQNQLNEY